jgi:hypothetical protein
MTWHESTSWPGVHSPARNPSPPWSGQSGPAMATSPKLTSRRRTSRRRTSMKRRLPARGRHFVGAGRRASQAAALSDATAVRGGAGQGPGGAAGPSAPGPAGWFGSPPPRAGGACSARGVTRHSSSSSRSRTPCYNPTSRHNCSARRPNSWTRPPAARRGHTVPHGPA